MTFTAYLASEALIRRFTPAGAILLLLSLNASAEVFRWVDDKGIVNYGSSPPAGSKATALNTENTRLSVVPGPPKAAGPKPESGEHAALRERVGKLESQLEEERRLRAQAQASEADRLARARADCEADRRLNCDSDPFGRYEPTIIVHPIRRPPIMKPNHSHRLGLPASHPEPSAPIQPPQPSRH